MSVVFRQNNHATLILFFNGWAADAHMIPKHPLADMCIISAWHTQPQLPIAILSKYQEIIVVAWSFGVVQACDFLSNIPLTNITKRIAINGSPIFIDNQYGIPEQLFTDTLNDLSAESVRRFMQRIWSSPRTYLQHNKLHSQRCFESIKKELHFFAQKTSHTEFINLWNFAIIAGKDRIFPPQNLRNYWQKTHTTIIEKPEMHHYPFLPPFSWNNLTL